MNYIEMVNQIWFLNKEHCFKPSELALYFHLLDVSNSLGWKNPFKQGNLVICVTIGMSEPVLQRSRQRLVDAKVLSYTSGKIKRELTEYKLHYLGTQKLYLSKHQSDTLSSTQTDTQLVPKPHDITKDKGKENLNFINIDGDQVFEISKWFEKNLILQKPNWQNLYPLANIDNCLNDFFLERAFETFNSIEHFRKAFNLKLKSVQEEKSKQKNGATKKPNTQRNDGTVSAFGKL